MKTKYIFINENTNLIDLIDDLNIKANHPVILNLKEIIQKQNNLIGYFRFLNDDVLSYIYIFPKLIEIKNKQSPSDVEKQIYSNYLEDYFFLNTKHKDKIKRKGKNFDFLATSLSGKNFFEKFDSLLTYQFDWALNEVELFSKKINPIAMKEIKYFQQSINGQIDIKNNIRDLNKTNIHQTSYEQDNHLYLINVVYSVVLEFAKTNILMEDQKSSFFEIQSKTKNILRILKSKFSLSKINTSSITSISSNSMFKKYPSLYNALLILLRKSTLFLDGGNLQSDLIVPLKYKFDYIFFNPADLFEVFVYDHFHKNGFDIVHKKIYKYNLIRNIDGQIKSEPENCIPDFVIMNGNTLDVMDAKWKAKEPNVEDMLKIWRDTVVIQQSGQAIKDTILIYPHHKDSKQMELSFSFIPNFVVKIEYLKVLRTT